MVYKKYVTRKGKRHGPYYYESVRQPNGKIKAVYLGTELPSERKIRKKKGVALRSGAPGRRGAGAPRRRGARARKRERTPKFKAPKVPSFDIGINVHPKLLILLVLVVLFSFGAYLGSDYYTHVTATTGFSSVPFEGDCKCSSGLELYQSPAEIGKPVEWVRRVNLPVESECELSGEAPAGAEDIVYSKDKPLVTGFITSEEPSETYRIKYTTPAPQKFEEEPVATEETWIKKVVVSSDASVHYYNVKSSTQIPETLPEKVQLFHKIDGKRVDVTVHPKYNFKKIDTNNNGLIDRLEWNVPQLSEQEFEIEIDLRILNVQSYPELGGNWTVGFNTTGTADLNITKDEITHEHLTFVHLKCGDEFVEPVIDGPSVIVENWNCDGQTAEIEHIVEVAGKHSQYFQFGDAEAWAYNAMEFAWATVLVDTARTIGSYTGLAISPVDDSVNICYYNSGGGDLVYANCTSNCDDTNNWDETNLVIAGDGGSRCSIAYSEDGVVGIKYYDDSDDTLWFARCDSDGDTDCSDDLNWLFGVVDSFGTYQGKYNLGDALATSGNEAFHMAYQRKRVGFFGDLMYAYCVDNCAAPPNWNTKIILTGTGTSNEGQQPSIAIDSNDYVHISSYNSWEQYNLRYSFCDQGFANCVAGAAWDSILIDSAGTVGTATSIDISPEDDSVHIAYRDGTNTALKYANCTSACWVAANWDTVSVDSDGETGHHPTIGVDSAGDVHIAYYNLTDGVDDSYDLVYANCSAKCDLAASWEITNVDTTNDAGRTPSIDIDSRNNIHISYRETTNNELQYAQLYGNYAPTQGTPWLNSSSETNYSNENLTCYNVSTFDKNNEEVTNIYNWYMNDTPIMELYLPFDNNTNSTAANEIKDYSANPNHGTLSGDTYWYPYGRVGGSYYFDGSADYLTVANEGNFDFTSSEFTVAGWFLSTDIIATRDIIIAKGGTANNYQWDIEVQTDRKLVAYFHALTGASIFSKESAFVVNDGFWHHFVAIYDTRPATEDITLYLDGVEQITIRSDTRAVNNYGNGDDPVMIGARGDAGAQGLHFTGWIDDIRIYSRNISKEQAHSLWWDTRLGFSDNSTIVPNMTTPSDVWTCELTPNDNNRDGTVMNSTPLLVLEQPLACGDTITEDTTLEADLLACAGDGLTIGATDITLDCAGYNITGTLGGDGVIITNEAYDNVVIKNCNISSFLAGISITNGDDAILEYNNISYCSDGIYIGSGSTGNTIQNHTIWNDTTTGITLASTSGNKIYNNTITWHNGSLDKGIYLAASADSNDVVNNTVSIAFYGIYLDSADSNTIGNNTIPISGSAGLWLDTASLNIIANNTVSDSYTYGMRLADSTSNTIHNNTFSGHSDSSDYGISMAPNSDTNDIINNTFDTNYYDIHLSGADSNNIQNNSFTSSTYSSIHLLLSTLNGIGNNTISGADTYGIYLNPTSSYNMIENGTVKDGTTHGIYLDGADFNNITLNTISGQNGGGDTGISLISGAESNIMLNNTLDDNDRGIYVDTSDLNNITNNTVKNSGDIGIYLSGTLITNITNNTITDNTNYGIELSGSSVNEILYNIVSGQNGIGDVGIYLVSFSTGNDIINNSLDDNYYGISLIDSSSNDIYVNGITNSGWDGILISGTSASNYFLNNTILNSATMAIDDATALGGMDVLEYENTYGNISWTDDSGTITATGNIGFDYNVSITANNLFLNSSAHPSLNRSAILTIPDTDQYGFFHRGPFKFREGEWDQVKCDLGYGCTVVQNADTYIFAVSNFSNLTLNESNYAPTQGTPLLNSSPGINRSADNITCFNVSTADQDGDDVTNIYNWYMNDTPLMTMYLPFDNNTNSTAADELKDYSANPNHGKLVGDTVWAPGQVGGAYDFPGSNDYIEVAHDATLNLGTADFSIALWMKHASVNAGDTLLAKADGNPSTPGNTGWRLDTRKNGKGLALDMGDGVDAVSKNVIIGNVSQDAWTHIVISFDRTTDVVRGYLNGTLDQTQSGQFGAVGSTNTAGVMRIGINSWNTLQDFTGQLDDVRIYKRALSALQAEQLFNDTVLGYSENQTIVSDETTANDKWTCELTPVDGHQEGIAANATDLTINRIPTQGTPDLNSSSGTNFTSENITCYNLSTSDPDGDTVNNIYGWFVNATPFMNLSLSFDSKASCGANCTKDYSGHHYNGTLGGPTIGDSAEPTWNSSGKVGGAYTFDGSDDNITIGDISDFDFAESDTFSVEAWVKAASDTTMAIAGKREKLTPWRGWYFGFRNADQPSILLSQDPSNYLEVQTAAAYVSAEEWLHIVITYGGVPDASSVTIYINGSSVAKNTILDTLDAAEDTTGAGLMGIGRTGNGWEFTGTMDEVKVYSRELSAQQVLALYEDSNNTYYNRTMVSQETRVDDWWECRVTPNDLKEDGLGINSSNLTILKGNPACGDTITEDTTLVADLTGCAGDGLIIGAPAITLDCAGYKLFGNGGGGGNGVVIANEAWDGVTIKNCNISLFLDGISITDGDDTIMEYNNVSECLSDGIYIGVSSTGNSIGNHTIWDNTDTGIYLDTSDNNIIKNSTIHTHSAPGSFGIYLDSNADNNEVVNNTLNANFEGIMVSSSLLNTLGNNTISNSVDVGIILSSSDANTISNNSVIGDGNGDDGISLTDSTSNTINNNTVSGHSGANDKGISLQTASLSNDIINNTVDSNNFGITVTDSDLNNILNNTVSNNGDHGISIGNSVSTIIGNNTIDTNGQDGIFLEAASNSNVLENNSVTSNTDEGMFIEDSDDVLIRNNTVDSNSGNGIELSGATDSTIIQGNTIDSHAGSSDKGIFLDTVTPDIVIQNNTLDSNYWGIYFSGSDLNLAGNNSVTNSGEDGIFLTGSDHNIFVNNTVSGDGSGDDGIYLVTSDDNNFTNNSASGHTGSNDCGVYIASNANLNYVQNNTINGNSDGVCVMSTDYNRINRNLIYSNTDDGIFFSSAYNNTMDHNVIYSNSNDGISFSGATYNNITNNTITDQSGASDCGIHLISTSKKNIIRNNTIDNNNYGIFLSSSNQNLIELNNTVSNSGNNGIHFTSADSNSITNNSVFSNGDNGVYLTSSASNTIQNNTIASNTDHGIELDGSTTNMIANNSLTGHSGSGDHAIHIDSASDTNDIKNNTLTANHIGIYIHSSDYVYVYNNTIYSNTEDGLYLSDADTNVLWENYIHSNTDDGIYFTGSSHNIFYTNLVTSHSGANDVGISLSASTDNNFTNNTIDSNLYGFMLGASSDLNGIINNTISNNGDDGIYITGSASNRIINNSIHTNTDNGIRFSTSTLSNISQNIIQTHTGINDQGINFQAGSDDNIIFNNTLDTNYDGISLTSADSNIMGNNTVSNNNHDGILLTTSNSNIIDNNSIFSNAGHGITLSDSDSTSVFRNVIRQQDHDAGDKGIYIATNADSNTIFNNTFDNNDFGIYTTSVTTNSIFFNYITDSNDTGIYVGSGSTSNYLLNNTVLRSGSKSIDDNTGGSQGNSLAYQNSAGNMSWTDSGTTLAVAGDIGFNYNITIEVNDLFLNASALTELSKTATITIYNTAVLGLIDRAPYKNATMCSISMGCTEVTDADTYVFTVTNFTNYSVGEFVNTPPIHGTPWLNSSSETNYTTENLTCYNVSTADSDEHDVTNIYNWYINETPMMKLNMPFANNTNSSVSKYVSDYSSNENNGTLGAAAGPYWNSSGKIGGCYGFDGINDYILVENEAEFDFVDSVFSVEGWFLTDSTDVQRRLIISKGGTANNYQWDIELQRNHKLTAYFAAIDGATILGKQSTGVVNDGAWHHFVVVYDTRTATEDLTLYLNGVEQTTIIADVRATEDYGDGADPLMIGARGNAGVQALFFRDRIDGIKVYDWNISAEQAVALFEDSDNNNDNRTIVSGETRINDTWTCEMIPNDAMNDGSPKNATNLTVDNTLPPAPDPYMLDAVAQNNTITTNRRPVFLWNNSTDSEGHTLTYQIYIDDDPDFSAPEYTNDSLNNDTTANQTSFTPFADLSISTYSWKVRAYDGYNFSSWSDIWGFDLQSSVAISMVNNTSNFTNDLGEYPTPGDNSNTSLPGVGWFVVENDGNCEINLTINGSDFWPVESNPTTYYRFKTIPNVTGSYADGTSSWTQVPALSSADHVGWMMYDNVSNLDKNRTDLHFNITVPASYSAGQLSSTVWIVGEES